MADPNIIRPPDDYTGAWVLFALIWFMGWNWAGRQRSRLGPPHGTSEGLPVILGLVFGVAMGFMEKDPYRGFEGFCEVGVIGLVGWLWGKMIASKD